MTQEELQQFQILLKKAHETLNLSGAYTDFSVKSEDEGLVLIGDNLWVQNAYGKSRKVLNTGVEDTEIVIY